jgi:hypothetical protein
MTVISAVITRYCTVHASDSLITKRKEGGTYEPDEWEHSKIVPVHRWRGAMSYWGLAKHPAHNWSTVDWLQDQVKSAGQESTPEEFAQRVTVNLAEAISKMSFAKPVDSGIGIHFTAYEYIDNRWIPELFLISNWADTNYQSLLDMRGNLTKPQQIETYLAMARRPIEIISSAQRDFGREDTRIVGGKPHDLAITPSGEYHSTTGDDRAC